MKITWLGEDIGEQAGPSFTVWNGIKFPKGKAVEVDNEHMIGKAKGNRFFKVAEDKPKAKEAQHVEVKETKAEPVKGPEKPEPEAHPPESKTGYSPVKKKVKKPKAKATAQHRAHG